ncbi:MAG: hypothetical protein WAO98_05535 [Alphaproteobacteria bacterium]
MANESNVVFITERFGVSRANFIKFGLGYGAVAAMVLSYSANKSILWMLIHGWFSWIYVLFFALFKS